MQRIISMKKIAYLILDIVFSPLLALACVIMKYYRHRGIFKFPLTKAIYNFIGVFPIRDHYYEPLFNFKNIPQRALQPTHLPGISFPEKEFLRLLEQFNYCNELTSLFAPRVECRENQFPIDPSSSFGVGDAESWYNMIRHYKPSRIIEIGGGNSTLVAIKALQQNEEENSSACHHICIEPYPKHWLLQANVDVIKEKLEDLDLSMFEKLMANDILFIDSSHIIRPGGDVLIEYLEILPILKKGVIVHSHDIFYPSNYPRDWLDKWINFWNEQYLLEAFLSCNPIFSIIFPVNYVKNNFYESFKKTAPFVSKNAQPGSFYIQKIS
jgi:hypothetical protein